MRPLAGLRGITLGVALLAHVPALAGSPSCVLGTQPCLQTQGTKITGDDAVTLLDRCEEFTTDDMGQVALQHTVEQALNRIGKRITSPFAEAWFAYDALHESPLRFDRSIPFEKRYPGVKRACQQLERDFYDDSRWSR